MRRISWAARLCLPLPVDKYGIPYFFDRRFEHVQVVSRKSNKKVWPEVEKLNVHV